MESQVSLVCSVRAFCCDLLTECIFDVWNHKAETKRAILRMGCDLLTECIFDVWNHKEMLQQLKVDTVVICLQNVSLMCGITSAGVPSSWWGEL